MSLKLSNLYHNLYHRWPALTSAHERSAVGSSARGSVGVWVYPALSGSRLGLDCKHLFLQPPMASHPRARASNEARAWSKPGPLETLIARISDVEWSLLKRYTTKS